MRIIIAVMTFMIMLSSAVYSVHEEDLLPIDETKSVLFNNPDTEFKIYDIGVYYIWKHSNGEWQYGASPGDTVSFIRSFLCNRIYDSLGPYEFKAVYYPDATPDEFKTYIVDEIKALSFPRYTDSRFVSDEEIVLEAINGGPGRNEKKEWQGKNVEGKSFYIPARITWKYKYQIPCDLAVEHLKASAERFVPGDTIRFDWDFVNHGQQAIAGSEPEVWAHLLINDIQVKAWKVEELPAVRQEMDEKGELIMVPEYRAHSYDYTVPEDYTGGNLNFEVRINQVPEADRKMIEESYDNNTADIRLGSNQWDFAVTKLSVSAFRPGEPVVGTFTIKNMTDRSYEGLIPFEVKLDNRLVDSDYIRDMAAGEQVTLSFRNTEGASEGSHTVRAEVNPQRTIDETTYSNNVRTSRLGVIQNAPVCKANNTHAEGVYYMSVGGENKGGTTVRTYTEPIEDDEGHVIGRRVIGYDKAWYADMTVTPGFSTKELKSGHGFQCKANVSISTNLKEGYFNLPSVAELHGDSGITRLQKTSGDDKSGVYELVKSNALQERKHFIPVSWKDGPYMAKLCFAGATTLGEELAWQKDYTFTIKGHMYMDDVTN